MPYSHHSHSGEFCNHAVDQLEDIVLEAIRQGFQVFALTEHMPRNNEADLYPGEQDSGWSIPEQAVIYDNFYHKARSLQEKYEDQIELLVGLESEWLRPDSKQWIDGLLEKYSLDFFVGSVHHVHGIPIDFDAEHYAKAVQVSTARADESGATESLLFEDYFDSQLAMLHALRPLVVGHFDLIRLLSSQRDKDWRDHPRVWNKIIRNLDFVQSYGGLLELNSSGLRKGLKEPYPKLEICKYFHGLGGRFVLSDDSHGIKQMGHSYDGVLEHAMRAGVQDLAVLTRKSLSSNPDKRFPETGVSLVSIQEVQQLDFWQRRGS